MLILWKIQVSFGLYFELHSDRVSLPKGDESKSLRGEQTMYYQFIRCVTDDDIEKYILYMLDHKEEIHSAFVTSKMVFFLKEQLLNGEMFIVEDKVGQTIAAFGFVNGTPEKDFANREIIRIELLHISSLYRSSRLFIDGMNYLRLFLQNYFPQTIQIEFYTEHSAKRQKLFTKFAQLIQTENTHFGVEDYYTVSIEKLGF